MKDMKVRVESEFETTAKETVPQVDEQAALIEKLNTLIDSCWLALDEKQCLDNQTLTLDHHIRLMRMTGLKAQAGVIRELEKQLAAAKYELGLRDKDMLALTAERDALKEYQVHFERRLADGVLLSNEQYAAIVKEREALRQELADLTVVRANTVLANEKLEAIAQDSRRRRLKSGAVCWELYEPS